MCSYWSLYSISLVVTQCFDKISLNAWRQKKKKRTLPVFADWLWVGNFLNSWPGHLQLCLFLLAQSLKVSQRRQLRFFWGLFWVFIQLWECVWSISPNKINSPSPKESRDCVFLTGLWMVSEHYAQAIFEMWYCPVLLLASRAVGSCCVCDCKRHLRVLTSLSNWCDLVWSGNRDRAESGWAHCDPGPTCSTRGPWGCLWKLGGHSWKPVMQIEL